MARISGLALLIIGAVLIVYGLNASDSIRSEFSEFFTNSPSNKAIWLLVLGIGSGVIGLFLTLKPSRRL